MTRKNGAYEILYGAAFMLPRHGDPATAAGRERLRPVFEKFGLHRALRLAGATPGDRVSVAGLEFDLWEYPTPLFKASCDGTASYPYTVTEPFSKLEAGALAERAAALAEPVERALLIP